MKAGLLVNRIYITLLRKILSEYLHEFNYDDFRLVKEECCADDRNTYWVCSNRFFELAFILTKENSLFEACSPEEGLLLLQELYQLILQIWDIFFTSFSFQSVSYVNFIFTEIFICYSDFYFIVRDWTIERNYSVKGRKCFYQDLATLQIWFWSGKRFSTYGSKNSLPNQDLANSQLRAGFDSRKISNINMHSRWDLKYISSTQAHKVF